MYPAVDYKECTKLRVSTATQKKTDVGRGSAEMSSAVAPDDNAFNQVSSMSGISHSHLAMCPANEYIIAGVYSYHSDNSEDRRWRFTCYAIPNRKTISHRQTDFVNDWDQKMKFEAHQGEVIIGVYSYHSNNQE